MTALSADILRRDFDRAFAEPPVPPGEDGESVLAIRAGDEACAVRLSQVRAIHAGRKVVALPGRLPAFMGITCLRSGIVAVYSLRVLLGRSAAEAPPRWLLLADGPQPFALAFEDFDAHARLPRGAIALAPARDGPIQGTALVAGTRRAVLSLPSIAAILSAKP